MKRKSALCLAALLLTSAVSPAHRKSVLSSLDPCSISEHLAFYQLYAGTEEGMLALSRAWSWLNQGNGRQDSLASLPSLEPSLLNAIIGVINKQSHLPIPTLTSAQLDAIEMLGSRLANRGLKGRNAETEKEVLALDPDSIDLSRALLLSGIEGESLSRNQRRTYEALLDLMALEILCRAPMDAPAKKKIRAMNDYIFHKMGFRFPPHSDYAKDIDVYTFLPSVLDSRKGVCLGVSILYLCLAQRLALPLEMVTPPGHIYVRYREGSAIINIETTARGIHVDCKEYLSVATRSLQQRTIKEVVGMAHFNQASTFWHKGMHDKAVASYRIAENYMPEDPLLKELMGYNLLLLGKEDEGMRLLEEIASVLPDDAVSKNHMAEDILLGRADAQAINAVFSVVDETRASLLKKKSALEATMNKHPQFRAGLMALASTELQLHRTGEAKECLERYHAIEKEDATAEYYLAVICAERYDFPKAWFHLKNCERIAAMRNHAPKALEPLRRELTTLCPEH